MDDHPTLLAKIAAGTALTSIAAHVSAAMDAFASWSLAAFGAGLGLCIGNLASLSPYVSPATIAHAGSIFLWMFLVCICQRYIASIVAGAAAAGADAAKNGEKMAGMDVHVFFAELLKGYPWPLRRLLAKAVDAVVVGDFAYSGRMLVRVALIQTVLVMVYTGLSARCIAVVFGGIHA